MKQIAVFASGSGTNANELMKYFRNHPNARVSLVVCNKPGAGVFDVAEEHGVAAMLLPSKEEFNSDRFVDLLKNHQKIDFIVLAGFLWLIPKKLIQAYPNKIVNIHPALLPKYGGKGMYGDRVHQAVIDNKEKESGITIHYVNEKYDEGEIIFQAKTTLNKDETVTTLAKKIHQLEHEHYPRVVEELVSRSLMG